MHLWLHMDSVASLPSSIIAGPNVGRGPSLSGNALDLEREMNTEEEGGLHWLRCVTSGLFSSLITTMTILLLCSHPSIKARGKGWGGGIKDSLHTPHFNGLFLKSLFNPLFLPSQLQSFRQQTRLPPPHLLQLTHPSLPISFSLGG